MITTVCGPSSPPDKAVKEGRRASHLNSERVPSSSSCLPSSAEQTSTASALALAVTCVSHKICIWAITILLGVVKPTRDRENSLSSETLNCLFQIDTDHVPPAADAEPGLAASSDSR